MKNLEEIIADFKNLNQRFYSQFCSIEKCNKCPYTGNCIASEFDEHESDLINLRHSLMKALNGKGEK